MKIDVDAFYMPFPERPIAQDLKLAESEMWSWLDKFGLCPSRQATQHLQRTRPEVITALYIPAADESTLPYLSQWMAWFFVIDDQFDHSGPSGRNGPRCAETIRSILSVIEHEPAVSSPVELNSLPRAHRALVDLWGRLPSHLEPILKPGLRQAN